MLLRTTMSLLFALAAFQRNIAFGNVLCPAESLKWPSLSQCNEDTIPCPIGFYCLNETACCSNPFAEVHLYNTTLAPPEAGQKLATIGIAELLQPGPDSNQTFPTTEETGTNETEDTIPTTSPLTGSPTPSTTTTTSTTESSTTESSEATTLESEEEVTEEPTETTDMSTFTGAVKEISYFPEELTTVRPTTWDSRRLTYVTIVEEVTPAPAGVVQVLPVPTGRVVDPIHPALRNTSSLLRQILSKVKPGACPNTPGLPESVVEQAVQSSFPILTCIHDGSCPGRQKCCLESGLWGNPTDSICKDPIPLPLGQDKA